MQPSPYFKPDFKPWRVIHQDNDIMVVQTLAKNNTDNTLVLNDAMIADDAPYGAFNLGLHVQDDANKVLANRAYLLANLSQQSTNVSINVNININDKPTTNGNNVIHRIHWLNQVHGNAIIDGDEQILSIKAPNADALFSRDKGVALAIMTADCVPICLHFVDLGMIACIHAGWQGLANGIIKKTINTVLQSAKALQSATNNQQPSNHSCPNPAGLTIKAFMGACIGGQNYEVGIDLAHKLVSQSLAHHADLSSEHISHANNNVHNNAHNSIVKNHNADNKLFNLITQAHAQPQKTWLNIQALAIWQLEQIGRQAQINIQLYNRQAPCGYADDAYYSHRRATHMGQKHTGRMAMLIVRC